MGRFVVRRVIQAIPTFFGITLLAFSVLRLSPGDPVLLMFGSSNLRADEIAGQDSDRSSGGQLASLIDSSAASSFPVFRRCFEIPRENKNVSPSTDHI